MRTFTAHLETAKGEYSSFVVRAGTIQAAAKIAAGRLLKGETLRGVTVND